MISFTFVSFNGLCGVPMHSFRELIRLDERNGMEYPYVLVPILYNVNHLYYTYPTIISINVLV